jgi:hypothetical protein
MTKSGAWLILAVAVALPPPAGGQGVPPVSMDRAGTLGNTPLTESSGVAVSHRHPGVLWSHNDSDHEPRVYAITLEGELLATYVLPGARVVDWEDLSLGPCPTRWAGRACLYVADTGDNLERRPRVVLYAVPEPDSLPPERGVVRTTEPSQALRVALTDGPHDVEAMAVDSQGTVHLITKGRTGHIVRYQVPRDRWAAGEFHAAPRDTLPIRPRPLVGTLVTGAAISPSGRRAAVRTFTEIYFLETGGPHWRLDGPSCRIAGFEPQGEAVSFLDEKDLVLTSEKGLSSEGVIHVVRCR